MSHTASGSASSEVDGDLVPSWALAYAPSKDSSGDRYPLGNQQAPEVMDQAANGEFMDPTTPNTIDHVAGRLFIPQHNGMQPLSQERADIGYSTVSAGPCAQQRLRVPVPFMPQVGGFIAWFPIPSGPAGEPSQVWDDGTDGCPNHWIIDESREENHAVGGATLPPQLTGYQTSNKVRRLETAESSLYNLTFNTNGVFIELYEDLIWRIAATRGTGEDADPISERETADYCDQLSGLCDSKNLSQWAEELHLRRIIAAGLWSVKDGIEYPALADPFPRTTAVTVTNPDPLRAKVMSYINPSHCDPALVDQGTDPGQPSALGTIIVLPAIAIH